MKEFKSSTGGRNVYIEDIEYLQDLALAFSSIFNGCDNFIISGCDISGTSIGSGYVYLNGKVRFFYGASNISSFPQYICELNTTENVSYNNGTTQIARNIYGTSISSAVPTSIDPITKAIGQYITITSTGGKLLKDAFFGKYAMIFNPSSGSQSVKGAVTFTNTVETKGALSANGGINIVSGTATGKIYYDGTNLIAESKIGSGNTYKFAITSTGFTFSTNTAPVVTVSDGNITFAGTASANQLVGGSVQILSNFIQNSSDATDDGTLYINKYGYKGAGTKYRNTVIGDGRGSDVLSIIGSTKKATLSGQLIIDGTSIVSVVLKGTKVKTDLNYQQYINFTDSNNEVIGYLGYNSTSDNTFRIANSISDVEITGSSSVNLSPAIKEGGKLLSEKYVLKSAYNSNIDNFALSKNVYDKNAIDTMLNGMVKDTNYVKYGSVTVNTLSNLPIDKTVVYAVLSASTELSLSSSMSPGQCLTVIILPTADIS